MPALKQTNLASTERIFSEETATTLEGEDEFPHTLDYKTMHLRPFDVTLFATALSDTYHGECACAVHLDMGTASSHLESGFMSTSPETSESQSTAFEAPSGDTGRKEEKEQELDRLRAILFSGSVEEHRQTFEFLKRAVDETRPSNRKFFP